MAKKFPSNPYKTMYKGVSHKGSKFHRPEGAGNFDNMDDYNFVKTINVQTGTVQEAPTDGKSIVNQDYATTHIGDQVYDDGAIDDRFVLTYDQGTNTIIWALPENDVRYVQVAGDTMTGQLILNTDSALLIGQTSTDVAKSITFRGDNESATLSYDPNTDILSSDTHLTLDGDLNFDSTSDHMGLESAGKLQWTVGGSSLLTLNNNVVSSYRQLRLEGSDVGIFTKNTGRWIR
jgi:hypothetical protein